MDGGGGEEIRKGFDYGTRGKFVTGHQDPRTLACPTGQREFAVQHHL